MRALYENKLCPHCRSPAPRVIFTTEHEQEYHEFSPDKIEVEDEKIGILYTSTDIKTESEKLLRFNCPDPVCVFVALGWQDLHRHVRSVHHRRLCDLCCNYKKAFTTEHTLFTERELEIHVSRGDDQPGDVNQTGFKGHPRCDFCRTRFYDSDKLYEHCRHEHERCFICDRDDPTKPHYYRNYADLENHFRRDHFLCPDRECLEKKFVVFGTQMDLKAHQLAEHGNSLSKDVRRDARMVDMRTFDYRPEYQIQLRRGGQRGRDPNADAPLPQSSAQPLRRDEIAFQRQMAVQSAQTTAPRTFRGQLSHSTPHTSNSTSSLARPQLSQPTPAQQSRDSQPQPPPPPDLTTMTPQERARQVRHAAVIERASHLLGNDNIKINAFRSHVSAYKQGSLNADQILNKFFTLFGGNSFSAVGTLIKEVADLFENKEKQEALRRAWNNWRAINEDYPDLPPSRSSAVTTNSAALGVGAILRSKAVTSNNTGSNSSRNKNMASFLSGRGSNASSSRSNIVATNAFPELPKSKTASSASTSTGKPLWTAPSANGNNQGAIKGKKPSIPANSKDAFPSLPTAPKPQPGAILAHGRNKVVRRDYGKTDDTGFSWGAQGHVPGQEEAEDEREDSTGSGKGKKKDKKVYLQWG